MARYIDADTMISDLAKLENEYLYADGDTEKYEFVYGTLTGVRQAITYAKAQPTADVAPKSEVDLYRKQVDELEDELASTYDKLEKAKSEVAREIFDEIYKTMNLIYSRVQHDCVGRHGDDPHTIMLVGKLNGIKYLGDEIAELKNKYTEEKT